jgi:hypothetical protein
MSESFDVKPSEIIKIVLQDARFKGKTPNQVTIEPKHDKSHHKGPGGGTEQPAAKIVQSVHARVVFTDGTAACYDNPPGTCSSC